MTTVTRTFTWLNTTSAQLQAWVAEVDTILSTAGLLKTTDTGQINIGSLVWSAAGSTNYGYQIWKFPDALQATTPIFIRMEYMNSTNASNPSIKVSVASSTDGAGTLTTTAGPITGPFTSNPGSATIAASRVSYCCYTDSTFALVLAKDAAVSNTYNNSLLPMAIDRQRSTAGVAQAGAYLASIGVYGSTLSHRHWYGAPTLAATAGSPMLFPNPAAVGSVEGTNVNVFRPYMQTPGVHPSLGALAYYYAEISDLTPQTFTILGANHTYLPVGRAFNYWNSSTETCAMIRWE